MRSVRVPWKTLVITAVVAACASGSQPAANLTGRQATLPPAGSPGDVLEAYQRAATVRERFDGLTVGVVQGGVHWVGDTNGFWYRVTVRGGAEFVFVDPGAWAKQPAFDHAQLAAALSTATGERYTAITLPFTTFEYSDDRRGIQADAAGSRWRCTLTDYACTRIGAARAPAGGGFAGRGGGGGGGWPGGGSGGQQGESVNLSPDGGTEAFIRNYNVAVRPVGAAVDEYTLLSHDGSEGDAYQLNSIEWSPDSRKLVAYRRKPGYDRRVHFIRSSPRDQLQPQLESISYRKPGDELDVNQPVLFDVETGRQTLIDNTYFPNPYQISRAEWREDGRAYTFEYNQRGHQVYRVLEVDGETGQVRVLINEETPTFFAYRAANNGLTDSGKRFRFDVDNGREIIWISERDGWNHLYLYDGESGEVKNRITRGEWVVKAVDSVDVENRQIYFTALGMNPDQDPYFLHFYRINFDGTGLVAYTEANGTHTLSWSPDRRYYVDTYSRVDMPPVVELRRMSDGALLELERGDMSAALERGWRPPEVFVAKGRDGRTDIWGIIVRPFTFDPDEKYPVIEQIYAGPQGSFVPKSWGGGQNLIATAELGFVLVQIDGMGTNNRSKAFHDVAWQDLADAGFPDRIRWHQAVADRYPWYDISRVGVYGTSAGGQNAAGAVLLHGDFYHAAFASSGCHDNRMDKIWWNEHWMGWPIGPHYEASSNVTHAHRLTGRLFLAVGEMDTNVDPASTMQLVDALVQAGKDFDLLVVPNGGHGATGTNGVRKRNDFFVRHLLGVAPPDWNTGVTAAGPDLDAALALADDAPPMGFFESPDDDVPPHWWW